MLPEVVSGGSQIADRVPAVISFRFVGWPVYLSNRNCGIYNLYCIPVAFALTTLLSCIGRFSDKRNIAMIRCIISHLYEMHHILFSSF